MATTLQTFREALATVEELCDHVAGLTIAHSLNRVRFTGTAPLAALPVTKLNDLTANGHVIDLRVESNDWRLHLRRGGNDGDVTEPSGPTSSAVEQGLTDDLDRALQANDFDAILVLLQDHETEVTFVVINNPQASGIHWLANHQTINTILNAEPWVPLARQLANGPTTVLIDDLDDSVMATPALTVCGPNAPATRTNNSDRESVSNTDASFRTSRAGNTEPYPSPMVFANLTLEYGKATATVSNTRAALNRLTYLLAWALLATTSRPVAGGLQVTVSGARELDLSIRPSDAPETQHLIELYRWVAASPEIDRLYFARQALTLAIVTETDVPSAAEPALRTAKSLYDLSRRNSVAEVMSARRSAREIALNASRSAATQARDSAAKAVERTVLQVAAAAGVVIAQVKDALEPGPAAALLTLIAALCAISAVVNDFVTLHSARSGLTKELEDLDRYRDSLSEEDVADLKTIGAITAARSDLRRSRATSWLLYGTATVVLTIIAAADFNGPSTNSQEPSRPPDAPSLTRPPAPDPLSPVVTPTTSFTTGIPTAPPSQP